MGIAALVSFIVAAAVAFVNASGTEFTDNPVMWALGFVALGGACLVFAVGGFRRGP